MNRSARWGMLAIAGLVALSIGQSLRVAGSLQGGATGWLLDAWPNFCAAFAIPFVWLLWWSESRSADAIGRALERRAMRVGLVISALVLVAWEIAQIWLPAAEFAIQDLVASAAGLLLAWLTFVLLSRRP